MKSIVLHTTADDPYKGARVEFLSSHELDRAFAGATPGVIARVQRGEDERIGKRRITRYRVGFKS
jgi:hypothetical protein